jgi:ABC-type antimicrobial peptide transport system permease subunit
MRDELFNPSRSGRPRIRVPSLPVPRAHGGRRGLSLGSVLAVALESLFRNKTRSFLATLGILIGVGCVVTMMGLAEGARVQMQEQVRRMGSNLLSVRPAEERQGAIRLGAETGQSLTRADADAIARACPAIARTSPRVSGTAQIKYRNRNTRTRVYGVTSDFWIIRNFRRSRGRAFTEGEIDARARVCLVGPVTVQDLFGSDDPLGKRLYIQGQGFRVVGVLQPHDPDWDDRVWVPVTTAMGRLFSLDYIERIEVQAIDERSLDTAAEQIETLMRRRHRMRPGQKSDFEVRNQQDALDVASETGRVLSYLLAGIGSVSLLVGGIGIMNIMLVSVTERTREIGIRRAVGARANDILWQFLVEALVMCSLGAGLGLLLAFGACWLGTAYAAWPVVITPTAIALACGFAVAIGIFFGLYPALRAAQLSPLTALRYD